MYSKAFAVLIRSPGITKQRITLNGHTAPLKDSVQGSALDWAASVCRYCLMGTRDVPEDVRAPLEATIAEGSQQSTVERLLACWALSCAQQFRGRYGRGPNHTDTTLIVSYDHPIFQERLRLSKVVLLLAPEARRQGDRRIVEALPMILAEVEKFVSSVAVDPGSTKPAIVISG